MQKERAYAKISVNPIDIRGVHAPIRERSNPAKVDTLTRKSSGHRHAKAACVVNGVGANSAKIGRDLVSQHLFQAEPKQVRRITAVGPGYHVTAEPGGPAGPAVAGSTTVGKSRADREISLNVTRGIPLYRTLPLAPRELALEELPSAPDRTKWVTTDYEQR